MDSNRDAPSTREEWLGTERSGRWIQQIWNAAAKAFQWQGTEASGRTRGAGTSSHVEWQGTEGSGRSTQKLKRFSGRELKHQVVLGELEHQVM
ncbi:uncharacterized protein LOC111369501 isoform X8 [Olea europaea var. sylvestris]|uniref:uncharacterized protein LOC111369501 isoform X7 n=1 Tax=Olea europaea var. sylvestris TaxID=158386 RepID=UPI000C1CF9C2|nr:uncharacterized protein LOC111369501 isoform X7 [Olea europaea var. sylvestris]XP_022846811.1 uncharacterized protein LOC111369501 isoform X7 [Olea europaea var. sylvestris]XP_022846813.1 uncharacterized protein LOC111369501 isoform X8 [Olea europaea var. sylvestris]